VTTKEEESAVLQRIRKSMTRWQAMNQAGRLAGRGLGRRELIGRVADEVGTSRSEVESALKK
jgi:hypothetical protein